MRAPRPNNPSRPGKPLSLVEPMGRVELLGLLLASLIVFGLATSAEAQQNRCADCHVANVAPNQAHLSDFLRSPHRDEIGCDGCHAGNDSTYDSMLAHDGILSSANPTSPVHFTKVPETCGACHPGPFEAFQESEHWKLLQQGDRRAPTCATCHSNAGGFLMSSRGLEKTCNRCHSEKRSTARPEFPAMASDSHDKIDTVRDLLATASQIARRNRNQEQRELWRGEIARVEAPLREAIDSAHRFTFDDFDLKIAKAIEQAEALLSEIANN